MPETSQFWITLVIALSVQLSGAREYSWQKDLATVRLTLKQMYDPLQYPKSVIAAFREKIFQVGFIAWSKHSIYLVSCAKDYWNVCLSYLLHCAPRLSA